MNVKSFQNDIGVTVNVDLDLVDSILELPDGRPILRFGGESVILSEKYSEVEPQVTAPAARRIPLPPPAPPEGDNTKNEGGENGEKGAENP